MILLAMIGAAVGAASRWSVDRWIASRHDSVFPLGTFTINVIGSLLLGVVLGAEAGQPAALLLGTGFCGGFTTFSTFSFETVRLLESGSGAQAVLNVGASLAVGLLAAFAGWHLGQGLF